VFGISLSVLALFFYWSTIGVVVRETDRIVEEEVRVLSKVYRERGLDWLIKTLSVRARLTRKMLYQFASPQGQPLAGNLKSWPIAKTDEDGWVEFTYVLPQSEVVVPARGRISRLPDGVQFLVARNVEEISQIKNVFKRSLQVVISLTLIFALLGGLYMSRRVLRRIGAFTKATGEIVDGRLDKRLESRLTGDEFDVLAEHLNEMLDRIESLIGTVRHVSDNIAHDLRTPLTRLRNKIEMVAASSPESLRAELESSVADADELLLTFASLLRIARIESGTYSPTLRICIKAWRTSEMWCWSEMRILD
jgi:signal transduction histidine kinase